MISISNKDLLALLYAKGYRIIIASDGNTKHVEFTHMYALKPYKLPTTFSAAFTNQQIREYCVNKLLSWSGFKVVYSLDY